MNTAPEFPGLFLWWEDNLLHEERKAGLFDPGSFYIQVLQENVTV